MKIRDHGFYFYFFHARTFSRDGIFANGYGCDAGPSFLNPEIAASKKNENRARVP